MVVSGRASLCAELGSLGRFTRTQNYARITEQSDQETTPRPPWPVGTENPTVRLGVYVACIFGAVVLVVLKDWLGPPLLLAALWYWYALTWVDKNGGWK